MMFKTTTASALVLGLMPLLAMTTLSPESMLSAPRRSAAVPNPDGTLALYTASSYSFSKHEKSNGLYVLDLKTAMSKLLSDSADISSPIWLGIDNLVAYIKTEKDATSIWTTTVTEPFKTYEVASLPAPVSNLKVKVVGSNDVHFVVSAPAYPNGTIYNEAKAPKNYSSGRVYNSLMVRHWDEWLTPYKSNLFSGKIYRTSSEAEFTISKEEPLTNLITGHGLESPVGPFGGDGDFDISPDGTYVTFLSKDPKLNQATNTATWLYVVRHDGKGAPRQVNKEGGISNSPAFSPDGKTIAYVQMKENGYEADRNAIFLTKLVDEGEDFVITQIASEWDRSPGSVQWSKNGNYLYLQAEDHGRVKLWQYPIASSKDSGLEPKALTDEFSVHSVFPLGNTEDLLVSSASLTSPQWYSIYSTSKNSLELLSAAPADLESILEPVSATMGTYNTLIRSQIDSFYYDGAEAKIHAWIIKPSNFDPSKKYPLAAFYHGGPQGAWNDDWSYRWNPAVFAEQGYIVVAFNPTGSTGYGQKLTDAIQDQWGGKPYEDLVLGFEHLENNPDFSYIDTKNAVALGASYGGYMINWVQGQSLGRKFKALVCHDGVINTLNQYTTEELWFPNHDFNGTLFSNRPAYEKWNPLNHINNWATPMFVVHNTKDYRLSESEGLMMFNVLQTKGVDSRFLNFPDENHWVLKPENSLVWHEEILGFIGGYTGLGGVGNSLKDQEGLEQDGGPKLVVQGTEEF